MSKNYFDVKYQQLQEKLDWRASRPPLRICSICAIVFTQPAPVVIWLWQILGMLHTCLVWSVLKWHSGIGGKTWLPGRPSRLLSHTWPKWLLVIILYFIYVWHTRVLPLLIWRFTCGVQCIFISIEWCYFVTWFLRGRKGDEKGCVSICRPRWSIGRKGGTQIRDGR